MNIYLVRHGDDDERYRGGWSELPLVEEGIRKCEKLGEYLYNHKSEFNIEELKEYIIDSFEFCLSTSKTDLFTRLYFQKLLNNENSMIMSAYQDDIEALWVFVYENNEGISYYIPTEIKKIIKKELNIK